MTDAIGPSTIAAGEETPLSPPARKPRVRRKLVLTVLAAVMFVAALLAPNSE